MQGCPHAATVRWVHGRWVQRIDDVDELFTLHPNGLFRRSEAIDLGYRDRHLAAARVDKILARTRHGVYMPYAAWEAADALEQHRLLSQAVLLRHDNRVALSHTSAAVMLGLRLHEPDLSQVHVTRLDGKGGRHLEHVSYHEGPWSPNDIFSLDEMLLVDPVTAAVGAAALTSVAKGVVLLDSLYDLDLGTPEDVERQRRRVEHHPFSQHLHMPVRLARPGSQSVGESLCRCHFFWQHVPEPVLQFKVYDDQGRLVGITDFAWPEQRLLGEFDGKIKYGRLLRPGQTPSDAVFEEKKREDRLREVTDFGMVRFTWADLHAPQALGDRVRRQLAARFAS